MQEVTKVVSLVKMADNLSSVSSPLKIDFVALTHCRLNELSHTIYWKILISTSGMSGYVYLDTPREKWYYLQTVETLIRCRICGV